uniref:Amino acid transporter transmembrane domain-containing protein n=1 Tax=Bionectria ochroleuca TaxID=29856 RepID=A0A8H7K477_BIOOC
MGDALWAYGKGSFAAGFVLYYAFVAGAMMLGISTGLNAVTRNGACTAVFVAVAAIVGGGFASIRTLGKMSWLAVFGVTCLVISIIMVTIALGVQDRPATAPKDVPWKPDFKIIGNPTFVEAVSAVSTFVFAYAGTPAFFSFAAEMRNPQHYGRAFILCQIIVTIAYVGIGCVVYSFCGSYVASPALGSAGPLIKKISYGGTIFGIIATAMLCIHLPRKYTSLQFGLVVSSASPFSPIPVFGGLVSFIGALLGTMMSFQRTGCMWLHDNWSKEKREPAIR